MNKGKNCLGSKKWPANLYNRRPIQLSDEEKSTSMLIFENYYFYCSEQLLQGIVLEMMRRKKTHFCITSPQ